MWRESKEVNGAVSCEGESEEVSGTVPCGEGARRSAALSRVERERGGQQHWGESEEVNGTVQNKDTPYLY